jgi:hypothetical protein
MASTKFQLEESKKPNQRYILELHTIREMVQEASNMDKGLRTVLRFKLAAQRNAPAPQQAQQPPSMGPFAQRAPPAAPSATRPPATRLFQPQETVSNAGPWCGDVDTDATTSSSGLYSDPHAATPYIAALSSQTLKSPKGKAVVKPKPQARRKVSAKANGIETATFAPAAASTLTSLTPVETKRDVNRIREGEADGATRGGASTSCPRR